MKYLPAFGLLCGLLVIQVPSARVSAAPSMQQAANLSVTIVIVDNLVPHPVPLTASSSVQTLAAIQSRCCAPM